MISTRSSVVLIVAIALSLGAASAAQGQETAITLQLTAASQTSSASRSQGWNVFAPRTGDSYQLDYSVGCTAVTWIEGEWSPWLSIFNWLYVDSTEVDYDQDFGFWFVQATTYTSGAVTPYDQYVFCSVESMGQSQSRDGTIPGVPTGETIRSDGWIATWVKWVQVLTPTDANYTSRWVDERDGGGGYDSCWYDGSPFPPFTSITTGRWQVGASNEWRTDYHGWGINMIAEYRSQGRAPCQADFYQNMVIEILGTEALYQINAMSTGITDLTIWSMKGGQYDERTWQSPSPGPVPRPRPHGAPTPPFTLPGLHSLSRR
jgi:hypothetical protein